MYTLASYNVVYYQYLKEFVHGYWICDLIAISHFAAKTRKTTKIRFSRLWCLAFFHLPEVLTNYHSICNSLESALVALARSFEAGVSSSECGGQPRPDLGIVYQLQRCI